MEKSRRDLRTTKIAGVLTGPKSFLGLVVALLAGRVSSERGYSVLTLAAIDALEKTRPDAAQWWRENTPHLAVARRHFIFAESACAVESLDAPASP
jgi:hypothetical protein